jgi:hypothetical protein
MGSICFDTEKRSFQYKVNNNANPGRNVLAIPVRWHATPLLEDGCAYSIVELGKATAFPDID